MKTTTNLDPRTLATLTVIFRAYFAEEALNLQDRSWDATLAPLWDAGLIVDRPLRGFPFNFVPSEKALETFELFHADGSFVTTHSAEFADLRAV